MADTQRASDIDPQTLEVLLATGVDPAALIKRRVELSNRRRRPEEDTELRGEQEALQPCLDASREFNRTYGAWHDPNAEETASAGAG